MSARAFVTPALRVLAATLLVLTAATALHDASQAWDVTYYHLPFAARLAGIVPRELFEFDAANEARFAGFPLLAERLQGWAWSMTGRAEGTNLVAFVSVPLLALLFRRRWAVPWHATVLALFAIPLVQTHAASAYVDLPANAAAAACVLVAIEAWSSRARVTFGAAALAIVTGAIAANMKVMLQPIVALALVAVATRALVVNARPWSWRVALAVALSMPVVLATPLANLATHANPFYPVRATIAGHAFPGTEDPYESSPVWLERAPRPARFACSVLEIGVRPVTDPRRWTVDQWMPADSSGPRMGGFFGAWVVALLATLAALAWRDRIARAWALGFGVLTAVVSVMPQSHELRYYLVWMITLVASVLRLTSRKERETGVARVHGVAAAAAIACGVVLASTRAAYVLPDGSTWKELVAAHTNATAIAGIAPGETVCVTEPRWNLLWAAPFHADAAKTYRLKGAESEAECGALRVVR